VTAGSLWFVVPTVHACMFAVCFSSEYKLNSAFH
jgi:hypothetical protein